MIDFFIKQYSTSPILLYPIAKKSFEKYGIDVDWLDYAVATFSMKNGDTNLFHIANKPAIFEINEDRYKISSEGKYVLKYQFTENDTNDVGRFWGEFKIDVLHPNYPLKLTIPTSGNISIMITPSITRTTVV